jgi:hypothetical protein
MSSNDDELWDRLGEALGVRPGWAIEASSTPGAPPAWCFGSGGEIDLSASVETGAIVVYVMASDAEIEFAGVDELTTWLDANEVAALGDPVEPGEVVDDILHGRITHWGEPGT